MSETEDFSDDLKKIKFYRNRAYLTPVFFIPYMALATAILGKLKLNDDFLLIPFIVFVVITFYFFIKMMNVPCPRCKNKFFVDDREYGKVFENLNVKVDRNLIFPNKCKHCNLEIK